MPALTAIFTGDIKDLERKMTMIQAYAKKTGSTIKTEIEGGIARAGAGGVNSGAMREALVLIREISRGNWTRVPGSASILVSRLGMLKYVLNPVVGVTAAIAAGFYLIWRNTKKWTDTLESAVPNFVGKFISRQEQTWNMVAMALKETNKEIKKTIELYRSAEQVAKRDMDIIREKYSHLRRMNELSKDQNKGEKELALNAAERNEIINSKEVEKLGLLEEEKKKRREANAIQVEGAPKVENDVRLAQQRADEARKWLETNKKLPSNMGGLRPGFKEEFEKRRTQERDAINKEKELLQYQADNNERLKDRKDLEKEANEAAKKAKQIEMELPDLRKSFEQKNKDEAEEEAARKEAATRIVHGQLTSLQRLGAFGMDAALVDVNKKMHHELKAIRNHLEKTGAFVAPGSIGRPHF